MMLMFGRQANQFQDYRDVAFCGGERATYQSPDGDANDETAAQMTSAMQLQRRAEEIFRLRYITDDLQKALKAKREAQLAAQDRRHVVDEAGPLQAGDKVWVLIGQRPGKLTPRYTGPYVVRGQASGGNYQLATMAGAALVRSVPRERLKLQQCDSIIDNQSVFRVEDIIGHRTTSSGRLEYHVKWTGYPITDATWEPEDMFIDVAPIDLYWRDREKEDARRATAQAMDAEEDC
jgi:hypothetical protein